jgi:hypothetical protein
MCWIFLADCCGDGTPGGDGTFFPPGGDGTFFPPGDGTFFDGDGLKLIILGVPLVPGPGIGGVAFCPPLATAAAASATLLDVCALNFA